MSVMQVLIHVPGDREAVINELNRLKIENRLIGSMLWIKNCAISLDQYGSYGDRLCFNSDTARDFQGKSILKNVGWGEMYLPYNVQLKIFNDLKKAILKHRTEF